jgi:signal transduction histidine kinase
MPIPVAVDAQLRRLSPVVESAAWFVASEALANVAKHAHVSRAWIAARETEGALLLEVGDDGAGGADRLQALRRRVRGQRRRLTVTSARGAGTRDPVRSVTAGAFQGYPGGRGLLTV